MEASVRRDTRVDCASSRVGQAVRALREFFAIRSLATRMNPLRYGRDRNPWPHVIGALVSLALSTAALGADGWTPFTDGWTRYTNERFGTIVEFPLHLFKPTTPPENGDGRALDAGDGARIFVFASYGPSTVTEDFSGVQGVAPRAKTDLSGSATRPRVRTGLHSRVGRDRTSSTWKSWRGVAPRMRSTSDIRRQ